jgi:hypothetical protein
MNRNEHIMLPYIPYFVIEALAEDRVREIVGLKPQRSSNANPALRRRLGAALVRLGGWLQRPLPEPLPRTI